MAGLSDADWERLSRTIWQVIAAQEPQLETSVQELVQRVLSAVRAAGYILDATTIALIGQWVAESETVIRSAIIAAVQPVAGAFGLGSDWMAQQIERAYGQRWPDGLILSDRLWRWSGELQRGLSKVLQDGARAGESIGRLVYDLQRTIEASAGERFAITTREIEDWATALAKAGRAAIKTPSQYTAWLDIMEATKRYLATLSDGGTKNQAESTLEKIRKAVREGNLDAIDDAVKWWVYDRQLYALRRIVRTEMANSHHQAILGVSYDDPDIIGYLWRLSGSHPVYDICDLYAAADFGLGPGVFPKAKAPARKAHPHCMCSFTPVTRPRSVKERGVKPINPIRLIEAAGEKGILTFDGNLLEAA